MEILTNPQRGSIVHKSDRPSPTSESRKRILKFITENPGVSQKALAATLSLDYGLVRTCIRYLRNDGRVRRQNVRHGNKTANWEIGRDDQYLDNQIDSDYMEPRPVQDFVPIRDPLVAALFGPARTSHIMEEENV